MDSALLLTAEKAAGLARQQTKKNDINLDLTLGRLMKLIETAASNGNHYLIFETPTFVLDGSLADKLLLASQLKKKLQALGYKIKKKGHVLTITWIE